MKMDSTLTRNRLQTTATTTTTTVSSPPQSQSPPTTNTQNQIPERLTSPSSFVNLYGFASRVSGSEQGSQTAASTPSAGSNPSSLVGGTSIPSISSLGTTANALYSSIGLALNSWTSPITAAAAAASATTAEAAAVVVAAASAISNHLSSPTSGTPPLEDLDDEDEECDEDDEEDDDEKHIPAPPSDKKSWSEIKATVNDIRKQLSNLSSMVPTNIQFRTLSDGRVRCYFLSTPPNAWETTLLYIDIHLNGTNSVNSGPSSPIDETMLNDIQQHDIGSPGSRSIHSNTSPTPLSQPSSPTSLGGGFGFPTSFHKR